MRDKIERRPVARMCALLVVALLLVAAAGAQWAVSQRPLLSIGEGGSPMEAFDLVTATARLAHGSLAVASAGTKDVRLFDGDGRPLRTIGREGEGPGEFRYPSWAGRWPGDSLAVWDANLNRISLFDGAGAYGRAMQPVPVTGLFPAFVGVFDDGSFVIAAGMDPGALREAPAVVRRRVVYQRFSREGAWLDTIASVPGSETFVHARGTRRYYSPLPFGGAVIAAVHGDRFYIADSGAGVIRVLDPRGRHVGDIAVPADDRAVTRGDWQRLRDLRLARLVRDDGSVGRLFADAPRPSRYPAFDAFLVDADGLIWIRRYTFPGDVARWLVIDGQGGVRASLTLPPDLRVDQVGSDFVLARGRGAYDVDVVEVYGLTRR